MPPAIVASGSFAEPCESLARMLAECATWQRELHVTTPGLAREAIHFDEARGDVRRPLAVITPGFSHSYQLIAGGAQNILRPRGSVFLHLARDTDTPYFDDLVQAEFAAANFFGQIIDELAAQAGADDKLAIIAISLVSFGPNPEEDWQCLGRYWFADYSVEWGDG